MFALRFESERLLDPEGWHYAICRIYVGDFHEPFEASLDHWGPADYELQWRAAARRIVEASGVAMFITSYRGPNADYHFEWPAWRDNDRVILQQWLVLTEQLITPFDPAQAHEIVGPRRESSDEGEPISQWQVPVEAVRDFVFHRGADDIYVPA